MLVGKAKTTQFAEGSVPLQWYVRREIYPKQKDVFPGEACSTQNGGNPHIQLFPSLNPQVSVIAFRILATSINTTLQVYCL